MKVLEIVIFYNFNFHATSFSSISYCSNSEYWPQKHDWDRASVQIGVSDLILLITEAILRHASGPAHHNIESVTFMISQL